MSAKGHAAASPCGKVVNGKAKSISMRSIELGPPDDTYKNKAKRTLRRGVSEVRRRRAEFAEIVSVT